MDDHTDIPGERNRANLDDDELDESDIVFQLVKHLGGHSACPDLDRLAGSG